MLLLCTTSNGRKLLLAVTFCLIDFYLLSWNCLGEASDDGNLLHSVTTFLVLK